LHALRLLAWLAWDAVALAQIVGQVLHPAAKALHTFQRLFRTLPRSAQSLLSLVYLFAETLHACSDGRFR